MDQEKIDQVIRRVRTLVPASIDAEDLAIGILIESWEHGIEHPSVWFIKRRCIDELRKLGREEQAIHSYVRPEEHLVEEAEKRVGKLIMILSPLERKVVWYRFYLEKSIQDIAALVGRPAPEVKEMLLAALYKMHQEERE